VCAGVLDAAGQSALDACVARAEWQPGAFMLTFTALPTGDTKCDLYALDGAAGVDARGAGGACVAFPSSWTPLCAGILDAQGRTGLADCVDAARAADAKALVFTELPDRTECDVVL
jgi:hypothetical protein